MTKAYRKERERELRIKDIIDAAEKLFFKDGYENVSMNGIATDAEMARATVYHYFKNKNDIYAAIALRAARILKEMFKKIPDGLSGIENIKALSHTYYKFYKEHPGYYKAYYHSGVFEYEETPILEELHKLRKENFQYVVEAITKGFSDGTIMNDIGPVATTLIMLLMSNNVNNIIPVTQMYMDEYGLSQDNLFDISLDLVVRSVEKKEPTP